MPVSIYIDEGNSVAEITLAHVIRNGLEGAVAIAENYLGDS